MQTIKLPSLIFVSLLALGFASLIFLYYPVGVDWQHAYFSAADHLAQPYQDTSFAGVVWVFFWLPHIFLPLKIGNAINFILHIIILLAIIYRYQGGWKAILLTFTSVLFLDLVRTNNVDWVPLLAFLLPPMWGLPFLASKPQVLGGAALVWWKKSGFSWKFLLPLISVAILSFLVWGNWLAEGFASNPQNTAWNFAPFPLGVPLGLYILYQAYQQEDEILGASATPLLVPYFAPYSLVSLLVLLACRYPKMAFYIYCTFWFFAVVEARRIALIVE